MSLSYHTRLIWNLCLEGKKWKTDSFDRSQNGFGDFVRNWLMLEHGFFGPMDPIHYQIMKLGVEIFSLEYVFGGGITSMIPIFWAKKATWPCYSWLKREWEIDVPIGFSESFQNDRLQEARHYSGCCQHCDQIICLNFKKIVIGNCEFPYLPFKTAMN